MDCATRKQGKLCGKKECEHCFRRCFASCKKSKCLAEGQKDPYLIAKYCNKKFSFVCPKCKHGFEAIVNNISKGKFCPYCATTNGKLCNSSDCEMCFKNSFASHAKAKCWSIKNKKTARQTHLHSDSKVRFDCDVCAHDFEAKVDSVSKGSFCAYCSNKKLCNSSDCEMCFKNSFASHAKAKCWSIKNKKTARQTFLYSDDKVWFDCDVCAHDFKTGVGGVSRGNFCPYCATNGKLCDYPDCELCFKKSFASHSKAKYWSDKNKKTARQTRLHSGIKAWFKCEKNHEFQSFVGNVSKGSWCLKCKHKTEALVFGFLKEHFENPKHQYKPRWCKNPKTGRSLPFDFCVSKTIIEVDGRQHYEQVSNWRSPEETQKNDRYKEECATKNGYSVFRISQRDIWNNKIDWKKLLLECVRDYETPVIIHLPE
ncbi:putative restriction endonuclease [Lausannevirus]|uniref:Putative restriction endonuclease n=1 Tax=Lausannevirus TaxID=999883 RepID=F2WL27_9VIRU|nr:putative restriction endonuclease [Lausannevirus]AEA06950.1 putative restriction endonuclease [Lausannevirus]